MTMDMNEKNLAENEPQTEVKTVDNNTTGETEEFLEMTLTEAWPLLSEIVKKCLIAIGSIKLWHLLAGISAGATLLFVYFVMPTICGIIWAVIKHVFLTVVGYDIGYDDCYSFLDIDLLYSIPVCFAVSLFVVNVQTFKKSVYGRIFGVAYFFTLMGILEYWDYSHISHWYKDEYWTKIHSAWLGGITFAIFFVVIPILLWICPTATSQEEAEGPDAKNICPEE